jgi:hypothetical protein
MLNRSDDIGMNAETALAVGSRAIPAARLTALLLGGLLLIRP